MPRTLKKPAASKAEPTPDYKTVHWTQEKQDVPILALRVDRRYQRDINTDAAKRQIAQIVKNFNQDFFGSPLVSLRTEDGHYYILDGQTRLEALRQLGVSPIQTIPCVVYFDLKPEDEAKIFSACNKNRRPVHPTDIYRSRLFAGDPTAEALERVLLARNLQMDYHLFKPSYSKNGKRPITSPMALETIITTTSPDFLGWVLDVLLEAWPDDDLGRRMSMVMTIGYLGFLHKDELDRKRLVSILSRQSPAKILAEAKRIKLDGRGIPETAAQIILGLYNTRLPEDKKVRIRGSEEYRRTFTSQNFSRSK